VRLFWNGKVALPINPEEAAVNGTIVRFPRRGHRADELDVALRQNSLAIPNTTLKIETSEAMPVASRHQIVSLGEKIPERIRFGHHRSNPNFVEQGALRK